MSTIKVRYVNDDWYEAFVDGEVVSDGHSVGSDTLENICMALGITFDTEQVFRNIYTDEDVATLEAAYAFEEAADESDEWPDD